MIMHRSVDATTISNRFHMSSKTRLRHALVLSWMGTESYYSLTEESGVSLCAGLCSVDGRAGRSKGRTDGDAI